MDACSVLTIIGEESMESGGLGRTVDRGRPILGLHSVHTEAPDRAKAHERTVLFDTRPEAPRSAPNSW